MSVKPSEIAKKRLEIIMTKDRLDLDDDAIKMLKRDLKTALLSYFEFSPDNLSLDVYVDEYKKYRIEARLIADGIISVKVVK